MADADHTYAHIQARDSDDEHEDESQRQTPASGPESIPRAWWRKMSPLKMLTVSVAVVVIPVVLALLCFLWKAPGDGRDSPIWRHIVLSGWLLKTITASSIAVRTATSITAVTATSMLASILLERSGIPVNASAPISAMRFINNGPLGLLMQLKDTSKHAKICSVTTVLLVCTTLLLQLTSTVLVADIAIGTVTVPSQLNQTVTGMAFNNGNLSDSRRTQTQTYWNVNVQTFPTFAEYHEPSADNNTVDAIRDTGTTLRAFLPFDEATARTSVKHFQGVATVFDTRTVCIRPQIHNGMALAMTEGWGWLLGAELVPDAVPEGLVLPDEPAETMDWVQDNEFTVYDNSSQDSAREVSLKWAQVVPYLHDAGEWNIVQKLMVSGPALISALDPRYPDISTGDTANHTSIRPQLATSDLGNERRIYRDNSTNGVPLMAGRSYIVLNITAVQTQISLLPNVTNQTGTGTVFSPDQDYNKLVITPSNEWLEFTIPRVPDFHLSASLCFDSYATADLDIDATQDQMVDEPKVGKFSETLQAFDTRQVLCQLGISDPDLQDLEDPENNCMDRGVLSLNGGSQQYRDQIKGWLNRTPANGPGTFPFTAQNFVSEDLWDPGTWGSVMCSGCGVIYQHKKYITFQYPGMLQRDIFQDTCLRTKDVSRAFQAYYTNMGRIAYYDTLPFFDVVDRPNISWFQHALFPQTSRGLTAVITVVSVHLLLVITVTVTFAFETQFSFIGDNAWQSIAQVVSLETKDILRDSTLRRDKSVKKDLQMSEQGKARFVSLMVLDNSPQQKIGLSKVLTENED